MPNVLRGVEEVDLSVNVMGQKLDLPVYLLAHGPAAAVPPRGRARDRGGGRGLRDHVRRLLPRHRLDRGDAPEAPNPQVYQFYFHKDRGLNRAMMERASEAGVEVMMLTVDSITGGNRERDKRTGFSIPFRLNLKGISQFVMKPAWGINYLRHESFSLPQLDEHVDMGGGAASIGQYFTEMLDPAMDWDDVAEMVDLWGGPFCLKGMMAPEDAVRAAEIGCRGVVISNHGGRQLDGSRSSFDQLDEIVQAAGDRLDVILDSGVTRGTHVLKALSLGAKAVGLGRYYLFPLAAAGRPGVERALSLMRDELMRDMRLMGRTRLGELGRDNLRFRRPA